MAILTAIASNTLAVTQTVAVNIVSYQKARNKLYLKHTIGLKRRIVLSVTNTLALSQDFAKHASALNRFSLTQTIVQKFGINAALSVLSLVSAVKVVRVKIRAIAHDLN